MAVKPKSRFKQNPMNVRAGIDASKRPFTRAGQTTGAPVGSKLREGFSQPLSDKGIERKYGLFPEREKKKQQIERLNLLIRTHNLKPERIEELKRTITEPKKVEEPIENIPSAKNVQEPSATNVQEEATQQPPNPEIIDTSPTTLDEAFGVGVPFTGDVAARTIAGGVAIGAGAVALGTGAVGVGISETVITARKLLSKGITRLTNLGVSAVATKGKNAPQVVTNAAGTLMRTSVIRRGGTATGRILTSKWVPINTKTASKTVGILNRVLRITPAKSGINTKSIVLGTVYATLVGTTITSSIGGATIGIWGQGEALEQLEFDYTKSIDNYKFSKDPRDLQLAEDISEALDQTYDPALWEYFIPFYNLRPILTKLKNLRISKEFKDKRLALSAQQTQEEELQIEQQKDFVLNG